MNVSRVNRITKILKTAGIRYWLVPNHEITEIKEIYIYNKSKLVAVLYDETASIDNGIFKFNADKYKAFSDLIMDEYNKEIKKEK